MPSSIALRIGPCFSPWYCGFKLIADSPKILPVCASLKNGFLKPSTLGSCIAGIADGKLPTSLNTRTCCAGAVRNAASSYASLGCLVCAGTVSHEPPQLPAPPGTAAMFHLPDVPGAFSLMYPCIHAGHVMVAKLPFWNAVTQSG